MTTPRIGTATRDDWSTVVEWAAAEGWNPGVADATCFLSQDPHGFFVGRLDGGIVSAISVVNYDDAFAFLGFYLVHPDHRGLGYGTEIWRHGVAHAGSRVIGLDAVPAQEGTYSRRGFTSRYRTIRYGGPIERVPRLDPVGSIGASRLLHPRVVPARRVDPRRLGDYEAACFPASRAGFVSCWLDATGHRERARRLPSVGTAYAYVTGGTVRGFGAIRAARSGHRIGPLIADTPAIARVLYTTLTTTIAESGGTTVYLDVPEPSRDAAELAESMGLSPAFETVRMYTGDVRPVALHRLYGVTCLELG